MDNGTWVHGDENVAIGGFEGDGELGGNASEVTAGQISEH